MRLQKAILLFFCLLFFSLNAQQMEDYTSPWEGNLENPKALQFQVTIENFDSSNAQFKITSDQTIVNYPFKSGSQDYLNIPFAENMFFEGSVTSNKKEINGFIKSGLLLYHVKLIRGKDNVYKGIWNILMINELLSTNLYLSIENGSKDEYQAYPIFADDRFTGTWCTDFQKDNNQIAFTDFKTGLKFKGELATNEIKLGLFLGSHLITQISLTKSEKEWDIGGFTTKNKKSTGKFLDLENRVEKDSLPNTHAVLISKKGTMIYEHYFDGYTATTTHDMRSSSKSISSAFVGIAKDKSFFKNVEQSIFDFLPAAYQKQKDSLKDKITIQSLLTMSSGLDAIDYGINANAQSTAVEDNYQMTTDWTKAILSASMIHAPNTKANYGSANPYLLGIAMDSLVQEPLELFMDQNLFQKLAITNYILQTDLKGNPYFGGGMYLTPRDMLKFGELYLNKGKWESKRVLSQQWVEDSFKSYHVLENTADKNEYGYLWWHHHYISNGKRIKTIEARGAGGQYIFVVPALDTVVVITSGNYRNGKTQQPEIIFKTYILPYLDK
jgi:CubicO group peptidase (beta-lactamase class C family)